MRFFRLNGLCPLGGLDDDSRGPTETVEVRGYSLGVLSDGLYAVKTDLTTFYLLANLRGGTIEFRLDLQLLESIYLRYQPRPYFFNGAVESMQSGGLLLKIARSLANVRVRMHLRADRTVANGDLLFAQCDPGFRIGRQPTGRRSQHDETLVNVFARGPRRLGSS
jgi:hypothetical protein